MQNRHLIEGRASGLRARRPVAAPPRPLHTAPCMTIQATRYVDTPLARRMLIAVGILFSLAWAPTLLLAVIAYSAGDPLTLVFPSAALAGVAGAWIRLIAGPERLRRNRRRRALVTALLAVGVLVPLLMLAGLLLHPPGQWRPTDLVATVMAIVSLGIGLLLLASTLELSRARPGQSQGN